MTDIPYYVLHPFDCLASRLANIVLIPAKRSPRGYEQLRAAIRVLFAYLMRLLSEGKSDEAIRLANRVFDLALTDTGKRIYLRHGIDLLDALPTPDVFGVEAFAQKNYSRQIERVRSRRDAFARFLHRFEKPEGESG